jgi:hypothetical protein
MKNIIKNIVLFLFMVVLISCSNETEDKIKVSNTTDLKIQDALVTVSLSSNHQYYSLINNNEEIPYQIIKNQIDNSYQLIFVTDLSPQEVKEFTLKEISADQMKEFTPRTYAELSMKAGNIYYDKRFRGDKFIKVNHLKVPAIHTDHDALFKYEGPGWESEKVGYRFYLDWRNATDIFGKKKNQLILDQVGTHDTVAKDDSYHNMQEWGMDIFKVGNSLGIGSIGMWADDKVNMVSKTDSIICNIPYTGPIEARIQTDYYGWQVNDEKYDLRADLSIVAGSRLTKCELKISDNPENLVTGLVKHENTELLKSGNKKGWNYLALYGNQTLVNDQDKLGIVIFYPQTDLIEITEDPLSYIVKLKPSDGKVIYYFAAAWDQEEDGIRNTEEFKNYLDKTITLLNNPVFVEIKKIKL